MAKHAVGEWWTEAKRIEVVTAYLVLGNAVLVSQATAVPPGTIRQWKTQPWWKELVDQIQTEEDQELDAKLAKRIGKALDLVNDRLEAGDFMWDKDSREFIRKPVNLRDSWKAGKEMIDLRVMLRKQPAAQVNQEAVADILKNLATEFATMALKKRIRAEVIDGDVDVSQGSSPGSELSERVPELPRQTTTDTQQGDAQCSPQ